MKIINLFKRPVVATGVILLIPFLLILFQIKLPDPGSEMEVMNWDLADFLLMGIMIFGTSLLLELVVRKVTNKTHRFALAALALLGFLWLWVELAVGLFTNWGG